MKSERWRFIFEKFLTVKMKPKEIEEYTDKRNSELIPKMRQLIPLLKC